MRQWHESCANIAFKVVVNGIFGSTRSSDFFKKCHTLQHLEGHTDIYILLYVLL